MSVNLKLMDIEPDLHINSIEIDEKFKIFKGGM